MSSKYVKLETKVIVSENADFSDPNYVYESDIEESYTVEASESILGLQIGTGAETLQRTDRYSTLSYFIVRNLDASNLVTMTYLSTHGAGTITLDIKAKGELRLTDVNPTQSPTFQATGAALQIDLLMGGET